MFTAQRWRAPPPLNPWVTVLVRANRPSADVEITVFVKVACCRQWFHQPSHPLKRQSKNSKEQTEEKIRVKRMSARSEVCVIKQLFWRWNKKKKCWAACETWLSNLHVALTKNWDIPVLPFMPLNGLTANQWVELSPGWKNQNINFIRNCRVCLRRTAIFFCFVLFFVKKINKKIKSGLLTPLRSVNCPSGWILNSRSALTSRLLPVSLLTLRVPSLRGTSQRSEPSDAVMSVNTEKRWIICPVVGTHKLTHAQRGSGPVPRPIV